MECKALEELKDEELIDAYRLGDGLAIEILVKRYKPFVRKRIRTHFYIGADKEDLIQEGMIGLFKAISDYDASKETSFKTFATLCVTRQLSTAFKAATRQKHYALNSSISLNTTVGNQEDENVTLMDVLKDHEQTNPEVLMIHQEELMNLQEDIKKHLSSLEWDVLRLHSQGRNYQEIAKRTGKSIKSIDNALQRIKRKLTTKVLYPLG